VTWTNTDQAPHDITTTSAPVAIHSPTLKTGMSWSYTFRTPGNYSYICSIHPDMRATVVVRPAAAPASEPTRVPTQSVTPTRTVTVFGSAMLMTSAHSPGPRTRPHAAATGTHHVNASTSPVRAQATAPAAVTATATVSSLRPLLLVAGLVAAVATFCLLLLASRPESAS
jgi:hypothetical protein